MTAGFWEKIQWPVFGLAPMDGVTDAAFRYMVAKYGKPSLTITEFTAAEGIRAGAERLLEDFLYNPIERPVVAQLFGADPSAFFISGAVVSALGFDGIDINMGCPAKNVTDRGAGAALILEPARARVIIQQTRAGNLAWANGASLEEIGVQPHLASVINERRAELGIEGRSELPLSVKTRLGVTHSVVEEWVDVLLQEELAAITIHGRTLKQLYSGNADWEEISRAAEQIHKTPTKVLGNGDVQDMTDAKERMKTYGVDGVLIGRAAFGNPWIFQEHSATESERRAAALEHARYFSLIFPNGHFLRMRKHLLDYMHGFDGAKELRQQLMRIQSLTDVEQILC